MRSTLASGAAPSRTSPSSAATRKPRRRLIVAPLLSPTRKRGERRNPRLRVGLINHHRTAGRLTTRAIAEDHSQQQQAERRPQEPRETLLIDRQRIIPVLAHRSRRELIEEQLAQ